MKETLTSKIMAMQDASLADLQHKYEEVFGQKTASTSKTQLWRKISYRLQEVAYGGLPEEARSRIQELIKEHDPINNKLVRPEETAQDKKNPLKRDRRLPIPGTIITKIYKGTKIEIKVMDKSFEYNNKVYKTLTQLTQEITGCHWNGYAFFNL